MAGRAGFAVVFVILFSVPMDGKQLRAKRFTDVTHVTDKEGKFSSPSYPSLYPNQADLQYVFDTTLRKPYRITLNYTVDIEYVAGCAFDQLVFRYQPKSLSVNLTTLCGTKFGAYDVVMQDGDTFSADFKSDASVQKTGFTVDFKLEEVPVPSLYSGLPDGRALNGGGTGSNVGGSAPVYVMNLNGNSGSFLSPSYPKNYPELVNYTYIAHLEENVPHTVHVDYIIDLEFFKPCLFDYVTLGDQKYCGTTSGSMDISVPGNEFRMLFYSDNAITKTGFNVSYRASPLSLILNSRMVSTNLGAGSTTPESDNSVSGANGLCSQPLQYVRGNFGQIASPYYPGNYTNSCDLAYFVVLDQPGPQSVMLYIDMDLEDSAGCSKDYLVINEVAQYLCGQKGKLIQRVEVVDTSFVIKFHTDREGTRRGFFMTYFRLPAPKSSPPVAVPQPTAPTARALVTVRGDKGQLLSPNYPNNYTNGAYVVYDVALSQRGNQTVLLTFDMDVEESDDCSYDYIFVNANQRHRLCGRKSGVLTVQTNYNFTVIFVSDYSVTRKGFNITYRVLKDQPVIYGDWGQLQSPLYPSQYPVSLDVTYYVVLSRPGPQTVLLSYDLDVEFSDGCTYDYVIVNNNAAKRLCSLASGIIPVQVETNTFTVTFHSDYSVTGRGLNLVYSVLQDYTASASGSQTGNVVPAASSSSTASTTPFIIPQIETIDVFIPQTGNTGVLKSPGFPNNYTNNLATTFVISVDPTSPQLVTLTFDTFDLELCDSCQCDWLEVSADPVQRFCGQFLNKKSLTVRVEQGTLKLTFRSDYSITGRGFYSTYSAVRA